MPLVISLSKAQRTLAENVRARRLAMELTQEGLSKRSGVPLPTLRKFEQHGVISLESFLKLLTVIGGLEETVKATAAPETPFTSIDDVLKDHDKTITRKRGRRT
jgi:transcriptional regulator with XRE-family HTH domain